MCSETPARLCSVQHQDNRPKWDTPLLHYLIVKGSLQCCTSDTYWNSSMTTLAVASMTNLGGKSGVFLIHLQYSPPLVLHPVVWHVLLLTTVLCCNRTAVLHPTGKWTAGVVYTVCLVVYVCRGEVCVCVGMVCGGIWGNGCGCVSVSSLNTYWYVFLTVGGNVSFSLPSASEMNVYGVHIRKG